MTYAVHQCAGFAVNPRKEHGEAVKGALSTRTTGYVMRTNIEKFHVWAYADFSGNWILDESMEDADTASRTGYVIAAQLCGNLNCEQTLHSAPARANTLLQVNRYAKFFRSCASYRR
jgi:hypothetical protein